MINAQHIYTSMVYNIGSLWLLLYWNHSLNYNILVIYNWTVVCGLICWEKQWSQQLFIFQLKRSVNLYEKKIGKCIKHEPRSWCELSVTLAVIFIWKRLHKLGILRFFQNIVCSNFISLYQKHTKLVMKPPVWLI